MKAVPPRKPDTSPSQPDETSQCRKPESNPNVTDRTILEGETMEPHTTHWGYMRDLLTALEERGYALVAMTADSITIDHISGYHDQITIKSVLPLEWIVANIALPKGHA